ncbi:MAG: hypothetical protein ACRCZA_03470 [Shewanella sp.]
MKTTRAGPTPSVGVAFYLPLVIYHLLFTTVGNVDKSVRQWR